MKEIQIIIGNSKKLTHKYSVMLSKNKHIKKQIFNK